MTETTSVEASRPKLDPINSLFGEAWQLYKKHFWVLIGIIAIPYIVSIGSQLTIPQRLPIPLIGIIFSVVASILSIISCVAIIFPFSNGAGIKESYQRAIEVFWPLIWVGFLFFVICAGGFVMLIIPLFIMLMWFLFTFFIFAIEKKRGLNVFVRGREYTHGYWWALFGRLFLFGLCTSIPMVIVLSLVSSVAGPTAGTIVIYILEAFIGPFAIAYLYVIYRNLVRLKPELSTSQPTFGRGFLKASAIVGVIAIAALICLIVFLSHFGNTQNGMFGNQTIRNLTMLTVRFSVRSMN